MSSLVMIKDEKLYFPVRYIRPNGSMVQASPTDFVTPYGFLIPLNFASFCLTSYLTQGIDAIALAEDTIYKAVLLGKENVIYELTIGTEKGKKREGIYPLFYRKDMFYGKAYLSLIDTLLGIANEEKHSVKEIFTAAAKLDLINSNHYKEIEVQKYFDHVNNNPQMSCFKYPSGQPSE